jgi:DNA phosphorothioation-dependent restriction protein DptG
MESIEDLFKHMQRRRQKRESTQEVSRFEKGDQDILNKFIMKSRSVPADLSIFIVQPGLSKAKVSTEQLELLSVTENYLMETYKLPFCVIASP